MKLFTSLFFALVIFSNFIQAQTSRSFYCSTPPEKSEWLTKFQQNQQDYVKSNEILYVPISLHLVGTDEGEGYFPMQDALDQLCLLNEYFEPVDIQFFLENVNYIDHTIYFQGISYVNMMNINNIANTVNCYIIDGSEVNVYGLYSLAGDAILMVRDGFGWLNLFPHEMGHYLSLPHTFLGWEDQTWNFSNPAPEFINGYKVERVDGVDCEIAGDGFCDTPPDYLGGNGALYFCTQNEESFIQQTDPTGATFHSDCSLIMSYAQQSDRFSDLQIAAMRANLEEVRPYLLYNQNPLSAIPSTNVVLTAPAQGEMVSSEDPLSLEWEPVTNATHYVVDVTTLSYFTAVYDQYIVEGNTLLLEDLLPNKNYRWRVRPYNDFHTCASYSEEGGFSTGEVEECDRSEIIGTTYYDLQTNASVCNRVSMDAEGNVMATWTMSFEPATGFPDRGTGYNRLDASTGNWDPIPTQRLEANIRTGWPNHIITDSGTELIVNHVFTSQGVFLRTLRREAGSTNWVESQIPTNAPRGTITARMTCSGEIVHVIAPTTTSNFGGVPYNGVNGHILYYRSQDGGATWDIIDGIIPGLDNSFMKDIGSIDSYAIDAREEVVAVALFSQINDVTVFKSENGGDSWESYRVHDFPIDMYEIDQGYSLSDLPPMIPGQPDPLAIFTTDGSGSILVDKNGLLHVFFGQYYIQDNITTDGFIIRFPETDGLSYWNENFGPDSTRTIATTFDLNGNSAIDLNTNYNLGFYQVSLTSMPSPAVDENNNIYLAYSGVVEGSDYRQNEMAFQYRHIWIIHSQDGGESWSEPFDAISESCINQPDLEYVTEAAFPSMVRDISDEIHFIYQQDYRPGHITGTFGPEEEENFIRYVHFPISDLGVVNTREKPAPGVFTFELLPNPAFYSARLVFKGESSSTATLSLFNVVGQSVRKPQVYEVTPGQNAVHINVEDLLTGLYLVHLQIGDLSAVSKLVVR